MESQQETPTPRQKAIFDFSKSAFSKISWEAPTLKVFDKLSINVGSEGFFDERLEVVKEGEDFKVVNTSSKKIKRRSVVADLNSLVTYKHEYGSVDDIAKTPTKEVVPEWCTAIREALVKMKKEESAEFMVKLIHLHPRTPDTGATPADFIYKKIAANFFGNDKRVNLFYRASFFNHSCTPNCIRTENGDRMIVITIRDIAPGEELRVSYSGFLPDDDTLRREMIKKRYDFDCTCEACAGLSDLKPSMHLMGWGCVPICTNCGKNVISNFCVRCRMVHYCDRKCQLANWKAHKRWCKKGLKQDDVIKMSLSLSGVS